MSNTPDKVWVYPWRDHTHNKGTGQVEYIRADLVPDIANIIEALENEYWSAGHSEVTGIGTAISIVKSMGLKDG